MSGYVKIFKVTDGNKDENNKLMSFCIDDEKLLEKYKTTLTEDFKNIKFNTLAVYDERYIKTKLKAYSNKVYTNFHSLNVPEDDIEWKSCTAASIHTLLLYDSKYYLQLYLDNCAYKIVSKEMTDCLDKNLSKLNITNAVLRWNWYKRRNRSCWK